MLKILLYCLTAWSASWSGNALAQSEDKALHLVGSATLAAVVTVASESPVIGFWSAFAVGLTKELIDHRRQSGDANMRDLAADAAGAFLGAQAGRWMLYRRGETTALVYARPF